MSSSAPEDRNIEIVAVWSVPTADTKKKSKSKGGKERRRSIKKKKKKPKKEMALEPFEDNQICDDEMMFVLDL